MSLERQARTARSAGSTAPRRRSRSSKPPEPSKPADTGSDLDLTAVTRQLKSRMRSRAPVDYRVGRDRMCGEVMSLLRCSKAQAEHVVDSMVARGFAQFTRHPMFAGDYRVGMWKLNPAP